MIISQLSKTTFEVECDQCKKVQKRCRSHASGDLHFCSRECTKLAKLPGGKIAEKIKKTNIEKYGCENVFSSEKIKEKIKSTCIENFGVDNPKKSKKIQEKTKQTCIQRYGVDNPAKSQEIKEKEIATIKNKSPEEKQTSLEKRKKTNLERYGVEFPMQISSVKENFDWSAAYKKSIETKKKNNTGTWSSKIENTLRDELFLIFGKDNVLEQVKLNNRWTIDFYIVAINSYVQLDGVYWHGLDRSIDLIKEYKSSKDKRILQTFYKDREQDLWAKTNGVMLYRITDEEIKIWQKANEVQKQILLKLSQKD